jgi:hypothetical protein
MLLKLAYTNNRELGKPKVKHSEMRSLKKQAAPCDNKPILPHLGHFTNPSGYFKTPFSFPQTKSRPFEHDTGRIMAPHLRVTVCTEYALSTLTPTVALRSPGCFRKQPRMAGYVKCEHAANTQASCCFESHIYI